MRIFLLRFAALIGVISCASLQAHGELEFHYTFDSGEAPFEDATGNYGNMGLGANGVEHRFGEESLFGGDGFSIGLDAPGEGHPTGSYMGLRGAPHPESFSISLWVKPQFTGTTQALFARDTVWWPSPCNYYCMYIDGQQSLVWKTGGVDEPQILTDEGILEEDETYHIVLTHEDSDGFDTGSADRSRIYVNGELIEEVEDPTEIPELDSIADANNIYELLWLGTLSSFGGYWGEMDDLQFYSSELSEENVSWLYANPGRTIGDEFPLGDFDMDGELTVADINALTVETASGANNVAFDMNGDDLVDTNDILVWVDEKNTWVGDANLDNEFNSADFVAVFAKGEYEDDIEGNSVWEDGDWDGDGDFTSSDFVIAFSAGGYELGPKPAVVPEPSTALGMMIAALAALALRRR